MMNHYADFGGCTSFDYSLTSNGLCHTFNGIEMSHLLIQKWKFTEINKAFQNVFKNFSRQTKTFRGIGRSEGKRNELIIIFPSAI